MTKPELVLYHYDLSPFSEKVRPMLGYAGLSWHSVKVPETPPRPVLDVLAGGYRKIPVAQIGADIYCDSKTIVRQIARLGSKPELDPQNCTKEVQEFVQRADGEVFVAVIVLSGPRLLGPMVRELSLWRTLRLVVDRINIGRKSKVPPIGRARAIAVLKAHVERMESLLTRDFLFGAAPCAADFSAYFSLWFMNKVPPVPFLADAPKLQRWMARMQAFGHGSPTELSPEQALDLARDAQPATIPEQTRASPKQVSIAPADYARDPTAGTLVSESAYAWVLAREHARFGTVHVHFPKVGFRIRE